MSAARKPQVPSIPTHQTGNFAVQSESVELIQRPATARSRRSRISSDEPDAHPAPRRLYPALHEAVYHTPAPRRPVQSALVRAPGSAPPAANRRVPPPSPAPEAAGAAGAGEAAAATGDASLADAVSPLAASPVNAEHGDAQAWASDTMPRPEQGPPPQPTPMHPVHPAVAAHAHAHEQHAHAHAHVLAHAQSAPVVGAGVGAGAAMQQYASQMQPWFSHSEHHLPMPAPHHFGPNEVVDAPDDDEPAYERNVTRSGAPRPEPDAREQSVLHYVDFFLSHLQQRQMETEQMLPTDWQTDVRPLSGFGTPQSKRLPGTPQKAASVPYPQDLTYAFNYNERYQAPEFVRQPEMFAQEMIRMREQMKGEVLSPFQRDKMVLDSYDGFLTQLRQKEQELMDQRRAMEEHANRGPEPYWWERHDRTFTHEMELNNRQLGAFPRVDRELSASAPASVPHSVGSSPQRAGGLFR